ncbi:MAG: hypothetical protein ABI442_10150 [Gemmatimonadaceae bacterium]
MQARATTASVFIGSVAAAATTGALIGVGRRAGSAGLPFAATAAVLSHRTPSAAVLGLVFVGLVLHVALTFAWAAAFTWLAEGPVRRDVVAACTVSLAQFAVSWVVAGVTGAGVASVIPLGDRIVLAVVMAGSLVVGMRFARSLARYA